MAFTNVKMLRLFTTLGLCSARAPARDTPAPCHVPLLPLPQLKINLRSIAPPLTPPPARQGPVPAFVGAQSTLSYTSCLRLCLPHWPGSSFRARMASRASSLHAPAWPLEGPQ